MDGEGASIHAQGMRKAQRKDLEESFKDCEDAVPTTEVLHSRVPHGSKSPATLSPGSRGARLPRGTKSPRTTSIPRKDSRLASGSKSPGTLGRGPKTIRQGHAPQRDTAMRQSTLEGSMKRAKGVDVGEGKLAWSKGLMIFFKRIRIVFAFLACSECMVPELEVCAPKIGAR